LRSCAASSDVAAVIAAPQTVGVLTSDEAWRGGAGYTCDRRGHGPSHAEAGVSRSRVSRVLVTEPTVRLISVTAEDGLGPRFSIVVPCHNEAGYVADTLNSLRNQTFAGRYEIIVVDNNCTDETADIARELGARVVSEENPGVCWARQRGLRRAPGKS